MALVAGVLLIGGLAACGDDGDTSTSTTDASTTTTTTEASTTTTAATTTTEATATTVEAVVARIEAEFAERYATSPVPGVTGPVELVCADTGPIEVGGVFACSLHTPTSAELGPVEDGNLVVYVLDATGWAAWGAGVDIPASTHGLMTGFERAPDGLLCRDLLDPDVDAYPFSQHGSPPTPAVDFFWSLVYWSLAGEPDRMDADGNGIPCETLYEPEVIAQVLDGGQAQ